MRSNSVKVRSPTENIAIVVRTDLAETFGSVAIDTIEATNKYAISWRFRNGMSVKNVGNEMK